MKNVYKVEFLNRDKKMDTAYTEAVNADKAIDNIKKRFKVNVINFCNRIIDRRKKGR